MPTVPHNYLIIKRFKVISVKWQYSAVTSKDSPDHFGGERKGNAAVTREEIRY